MNYTETTITFTCAGETLLGILALPAAPCHTSVVIPVGGPQYRAGSHRQFTLVARQLAEAGYSVLRFDYRGMGDSTGAQIDFESTTPDIAAAIDTLIAKAPTTRQVVLWGLCDAASASLIAAANLDDDRIGGLCLLNPWVRSEATLAKTQVKHYYAQRLLNVEFWRKLASGQVKVGASIAELLSKVRKASTATKTSPNTESFQARMARGLSKHTDQTLLILSGNDYTAKEFLEYCATDTTWARLLKQVTRIDIENADHTFSTAEWRNAVAQTTLEWLKKIDKRDRDTQSSAKRLEKKTAA